MPNDLTLVLSNGGLRSLLALACAIDEHGARQVGIVHVVEQRPGAVRRSQAARRQAEHFGIRRFHETTLGHLKPGSEQPPGERATLGMSQILLAAMARVVDTDAGRLIWPAQVGEDHEAVGRLSEQALAVQQLAAVEHPESPMIHTPLLELTDCELVLLLGQMQLPIELAWSCLGTAARPCRACDGCRRRRHGFEQAGVVDPVDSVAAKAG